MPNRLKTVVWQTDFQAAQAKAKAQKKVLLVAFTRLGLVSVVQEAQGRGL